jgi:hypothetical protein
LNCIEKAFIVSQLNGSCINCGKLVVLDAKVQISGAVMLGVFSSMKVNNEIDGKVWTGDSEGL